MGMNDGSLSRDHLHVSSVYQQQFSKYGTGSILLNSKYGWKPASNSKLENIMVSNTDD